MKKQRGFVELIMYLVIAGIAVIVGWTFQSWSCSSKWEFSGMKTSYGPIKGCLVQTPNGRWMPEERIREVDLTPRAEEAAKQGGK